MQHDPVPSHSSPLREERPAGVIAISALCAIAGAAALGFAAFAVEQVVPLSAGAFLIGGGLEQLGPVAFLLDAALMFLLAVALWKRWPGARRVAVVVAVIGIAMAVPGLSSAVMDSRLLAIGREGLQIMVRVMVVYYLSQAPVKDWFSPR
jgi:hypothetical protein